MLITKQKRRTGFVKHKAQQSHLFHQASLNP